MGEYELKTLRQEYKFVLPIELALLIKGDIERIMQLDSHSPVGGYIINSLYFDSINNIDFATKLSGTEIRKKIRLRTYDGSNIYKIEIKQKMGNLQQKESVLIDTEDAKSLTSGDYTVLMKYFDKTDSAKKIYKTLEMGCYTPVNYVQYQRIAFVNPFCDTRVTFDSNIKASEVDFTFFEDNKTLIPIMDDRVVLEVKFSGKLLGYISDILAKYNITQSSYSKYCSGRQLFYDFNY